MSAASTKKLGRPSTWADFIGESDEGLPFLSRSSDQTQTPGPSEWLILLPTVFARRHAGLALEESGKIGLAGITSRRGDVGDAEVAGLQKFLGAFETDPRHLFAGRAADDPEQIRGRFVDCETWSSSRISSMPTPSQARSRIDRNNMEHVNFIAAAQSGRLPHDDFSGMGKLDTPRNRLAVDHFPDKVRSPDTRPRRRGYECWTVEEPTRGSTRNY